MGKIHDTVIIVHRVQFRITNSALLHVAYIPGTLTYFEGVCLTHFILTPGGCGRVVRAAADDARFAGMPGSRGSTGEFQKRRSWCYMHDLRARDLPKIGPDPSLAQAQPTRDSGSPWERFRKDCRSSDRASGCPIYILVSTPTF